MSVTSGHVKLCFTRHVWSTWQNILHIRCLAIILFVSKVLQKRTRFPFPSPKISLRNNFIVIELSCWLISTYTRTLVSRWNYASICFRYRTKLVVSTWNENNFSTCTNNNLILGRKQIYLYKFWETVNKLNCNIFNGL